MRKRNRAAKLLRLRLISLAVASCFSAELAFANPTGPVVANGQVSIIQNGNLLQITNSPNSIINWQSFSIGANEITRFLQQSNSSAVLNRVITQNPSAILGALQSNGRVFLINPNGILFGAGAQVDVAGLIASTLNLSDMDFLAGRLRFTEVPGAVSVVNQGAINAASGGQVYLVGPAVTNSGVITSPQGEVILAAGNSVELVSPGTPNLRVEIIAPDNQALNLGQIIADSGRVGIYAGLINHSGTIRANSAQVTEDGRIVLKATKGVTLEAGSVTAASGARGGEITVETETGTIRVAGQLDATGSEAGGAINISVTGATGGIDLGTGLNSGNASVSVSGPGSTTTLNADIITAGAGITINDSVILGVPATITLDTTNGGAVASGANITITGTTNDDATPSGLVLRAGTGGANTLGGAVGNTTPIASLMTSGNTTAINGGLVKTTGNQTYNGAVTLGTATTLAATGAAGNIAINNSLLGGANSLTINSGNNVVIAGNVFSGPQTVNAGGGLIVQGSAAGSALLQATGGQTINARFIDVTAQGNSSATISNATSGNQVITVAGGGASPGIDVRSLASGGNASIGNNVSGAAQTITVTDADHINVNGFGPSNFSNVSASIQAGLGTQTISITGNGANAINVGSAGAQDGSIINARSQSITAGAGGQSGSITIIGPAVNGSLAAILTNPGGNTQTISTSGALTVTGGTAPAQGSNFPSGFFHNSSGPQTVTAESITLKGGLSGSLNGVNIRSAGGGDQTINASHIAITGGTGTSNFALIERTAGGSGNQTIVAYGGTIALQGGSGGPNNVVRIRNDGTGTQTISGSPQITLIGGTGGEPSLGNFAQIRAVGSQVITAGETMLKAGDSGFSNSANIAAPVQTITVHGNLTLTGGGSISGPTSSTDARIGGLGGTTQTPTNLMLTVDGNVTMNGGTLPNAGATIGSNLDGGQTTNITMAVGGNLTLNTGSAPDANPRIGSPAVNAAGGNIFVGAGNIALNSAGPGLGSAIRTTGNVTLLANSITQRADSSIVAGSLGVGTLNGASLGGANQVSLFSLFNSSSGEVLFSNASPLLSVAFPFSPFTAISQVPTGTLTLNQAGDLAITGNVLSGPQSINVTGNIVVGSPNNSVNVSATGMQSVNVGGVLALQGASSSTNRFARLSATGDQTITASGITLTGGGGINSNSAEIRQLDPFSSQTITINNGGTLALQGGSGGSNNFARIRNEGVSQLLDFPSGGSLTLTGGSGVSNDPAHLRANAGTQTITGSPAITLTGGTGGMPDLGNNAQIRAVGAQDITAGNTTLTAGASGFNNFAGINSPDQDITVHGHLTLTGGGSSSGVTGSADARIGGLGGTTPTPTNLMLTVDGDVTMNGGAATNAGSHIGSAFTGGQRADITMIVDGNLTLGTGTADTSSSRIGSASTNPAGGTISIAAHGNITLQNSTRSDTRSVIRALDSLTLDANNITVGGSVISGAQTIHAAGDLKVLAAGAGNALMTATGPQSINAGGALTVQGGAGSGLSAQLLGSAGQTINASSIAVTGGSVGSSSFAEVLQTSAGAGQVIAINSGGAITLQGGPSGTNNYARIRNEGTALQSISGSPVITLTGGTGGAPDLGNFASIIAAVGPQTITAGDTTLTAGGVGFNNTATILSPLQTMIVHGDLTLTGGSSASSAVRDGAARIGGLNVPPGTPTNLTLTVDENVTMTGGSMANAGAVIGSGFLGGQRTDITMDVTGNVTMNPGTVANAGSRIGSPSAGPAGGNISVTAGGNLVLNSAPGLQGSVIRTTESVALQANSIAQGPNAKVNAGSLTTNTVNGVDLVGSNEVSNFNAVNTTSGNIAFNNSGNLEVTASNTAPGGKITINNLVGDLSTSGPVAASGGGAADVALAAGGAVNIAHPVTATGTGNVTLTGGAITVDDTTVVAGGSVSVTGASLDVKGVSSGALIQAGDSFNANVSGDLRVRSASTGGGLGGWAVIVAEGADSNAPAGEPNAAARALGVGLLDRVAGHGPVNISAGSVALEGGGNPDSIAMITGGPINATTTTGDFSITGGSGLGSFGWVLSNQNVNLTIGGNLMLNSGPGLLSFARMQTVHPTSVINVYFPNLSEGGYFVNGVEGAFRDGLTGFFTGPVAAKPGTRLITTYGVE